MSCVQGSGILSCVNQICKMASDFALLLTGSQDSLEAAIKEVMLILDESGAALKCVINGPNDGTCTMPNGTVLPTLANKLENLNACQINSIVSDEFSATQDQTDFTLSFTPTNNQTVEVALNGAYCRYPADFTLAGNVITFVHALDVNDGVSARGFVS